MVAVWSDPARLQNGNGIIAPAFPRGLLDNGFTVKLQPLAGAFRPGSQLHLFHAFQLLVRQGRALVEVEIQNVFQDE